MKKIFIGIVAAVMMVSLTACGGSGNTASGNWNYKTGVAAYTRTGDAYGAAAADTDKITSTIVAAVFDDKGNIVKVNIDEVEARPGAAGEITSKKELGDDYGMKAVSSIGKEWHEQIANLEKWLEGKDISRLTSTVAGRMGEYSRSNSRPSGAAAEWTARNPDGTTGGTMPDSAVANSGRNSGGNSGTGNSGGNSGTGNSGRNSGSDNSSTANSGTGGTDNSGGMMNDMMDGLNSTIDDMTDGGQNDAGTTAGMWMDEDLRSMVTIDTTNIQTAIEKAWRNAK